MRPKMLWGGAKLRGQKVTVAFKGIICKIMVAFWNLYTKLHYALNEVGIVCIDSASPTQVGESPREQVCVIVVLALPSRNSCCRRAAILVGQTRTRIPGVHMSDIITKTFIDTTIGQLHLFQSTNTQSTCIFSI